MRILFLTSEVAPFSKTGGLGDVACALPVALAHLGHHLRVVTPLYRDTPRAGLENMGTLTLHFPFGQVLVHIKQLMRDERLTHVFVDVPGLYGRPALYGYEDDARRFAVLSMAALGYALRSGFIADVVHGHDWHAGLAAMALQYVYAHTPLSRARTVFTIHNLAYQGNFPRGEFEALGLPAHLYGVDGVEFHGQLSFMKAALRSYQAITTVSPSYAQEIQTRLGGHGFDGVLRARAADVVGILNGINACEWNPGTDVFLPARFTAASISGKAVCREALLKAYGLSPPRQGQPVFGMVGRLVEQKGVDLLLEALPQLLRGGVQAVVLGQGDASLERGLQALAAHFPRQLGVRIDFDDALAHLITAGSDFFLMPSRFEPCGLNQMYALLYGAVPVVREVGGLKDTVVDVDTDTGTGIVFTEMTASALSKALHRAVQVYQQPDAYRAVQHRGMRQNFSWSRSARAYEALYAHPGR